MPLVKTRTTPWPYPLPYDKQAVPVPGTKRPGQTAHYQNGIWGLIDHNTSNALKTLDELFNTGLSGGKDKPFLGSRPVISTNPLKFANYYVWHTYGEIDVRRRHLGSALDSLFRKGELGGGELETVGIWSINRPEWQLVDIALQSYNKVSVSLYDTLGKDAVEYIINHAHLTVIFCTSDHVPSLLRLASRVPFLKLIVCIDSLTPDAKSILTEWAFSQNIKFQELCELEAYGKANLIDPIRATPKTIASICYTSGTTSNPKGVVLSHGNLALSTQSNLLGLNLPDDGCMLSYLPLAHIYERICELCLIAVGGSIGYFTGDPLRLLEDAQLLKPHFFPSVPRVLTRVYQAAMAGGNVPGLKGLIFSKALQVKLNQLHTTGQVTHVFWDRLVFRKIQAVLGGNIRLIATGSAPINPKVMDFMKVAFSCELTFLVGYGMTEGCATCSRTVDQDPTSSGTVGPPQPICEVKLIDVPVMEYTSEDKPNPRGELCMRGANCFSVYYKDEKNTREAVDEEGWVHTGDIAEIDQVGRIKIIDRVKNIMKLAQGEYVALEKIENLYSTLPMVAQIYVHGDSLQTYLLAVVIPDPVPFSEIVSKLTGKQVAAVNIDELSKACADERVKQHFLEILSHEGKNGGLRGFEIVKRVYLCMEPFSIEDGTLTPTMKIRRRDAHNKYKAELDALYQLGEPTTKL